MLRSHTAPLLLALALAPAAAAAALPDSYPYPTPVPTPMPGWYPGEYPGEDPEMSASPTPTPTPVPAQYPGEDQVTVIQFAFARSVSPQLDGGALLDEVVHYIGASYSLLDPAYRVQRDVDRLVLQYGPANPQVLYPESTALLGDTPVEQFNDQPPSQGNRVVALCFRGRSKEWFDYLVRGRTKALDARLLAHSRDVVSTLAGRIGPIAGPNATERILDGLIDRLATRGGDLPQRVSEAMQENIRTMEVDSVTLDAMATSPTYLDEVLDNPPGATPVPIPVPYLGPYPGSGSGILGQ